MNRFSKVKSNPGDKDKKNELTSSSIDNKKLSEKYKTNWTETEDLKNIKLKVFIKSTDHQPTKHRPTDH